MSIKVENAEIFGWESAIRGMRNPLESWSKSDSRREFIKYPGTINPNGEVKMMLGENDLKLMKSLSKAGSDHAKFLRMITAVCDITAPLYWWKEFDTYKIGTVANSCSTMHKIHEKEFTLEDFSYEHLMDDDDYRLDNFESLMYEDQDMGKVLSSYNTGEINDNSELCYLNSPLDDLKYIIGKLNVCRRVFLDKSIAKEKRKIYWWQMIQLLPSSYNQRRTVQLNYQVLKSMYFARRNHKLDEWRMLCRWIEALPYFKEIILEE